ncbi:MAG: beta-lactamase family protein [Anaerolineae bacterium]|nr:beta-lactamase family protein [Gemmatimonadaceae bacterium]
MPTGWRRPITCAALVSGLAVSFLSACGNSQITAPATSVPDFEKRLENLRTRSHIPAITAVIAKGQAIVWVKGFGIADLATQRPAADTTVYHLASLTKPFAATVILQLVEEGKVSLDDPVSRYGIQIPGPGIVLVRHLLSHTSEGTPGARYSYNGNRFGLLDSVIVRATGMSLGAALQERIFAKIGLHHTAPNPQSAAFRATSLNRAAFEANMARGYTYSGSKYNPTSYPSYFGSAAGLTASAVDVALFSMALDRGALLRPETRVLAYTPTVDPTGTSLPYALGWFSTRYKGVRIIWHYGLWTANSSLIIKVPERDLTFVVLANTDALSQAYPLGAGKLESSPWAREFLDAFVIGSLELPSTR